MAVVQYELVRTAGQKVQVSVTFHSSWKELFVFRFSMIRRQCVFNTSDSDFRLALGSFVEEYNNKVQIVALDENISEFTVKSTFDHPYPTTKIMWIPDSVRLKRSTLSFTRCSVR